MKKVIYTIFAGVLATVIYGAFVMVLLPCVGIAVGVEWLWNWQDRNRIQNDKLRDAAQ